MNDNLVKPSFICPVCKSIKLDFQLNKIFCKNRLCNSSFEIIEKVPVLVDFKKSVLNKDAFIDNKGDSPIERNNLKFLKNIKSFFIGDSTITKNNIELILSLLSELQNPKILIVGGGSIGNGIEKLYKKYSKNIISFDIYMSKNIHFIADGHSIPVLNNSFDFVLVQAVLEHVIDPQLVVSEIHRVLKDNSIVYSETPFLQHVHEGAYDFHRFTESGHRYLFKNFKLIKSGYTKGVGTTLIWSLAYFFQGLFNSKKINKLTRLFFFWLRFFDKIISNKHNIDGACGCFFIGRKSDEILNQKKLISFYNGSQK